MRNPVLVFLAVSLTPETDCGKSRPVKAGSIAIVLIGILVGLPSLAYPYGRDQGIFGVVANSILEGGLPYRDVFDIKPPAIFYTYAVIQTVFGSGASALRLATVMITDVHPAHGPRPTRLPGAF